MENKSVVLGLTFGLIIGAIAGIIYQNFQSQMDFVNLKLENEDLEDTINELENTIANMESNILEMEINCTARIQKLGQIWENNLEKAYESYGIAAAQILYQLGYEGCIILWNASSREHPDFVNEFQRLGGTILYPQGVGLHGDLYRTGTPLKQNLANADHFDEGYTTDTEYNNWVWISREGYNHDNVILVLFGVNETFDLTNYQGEQYPHLGGLDRIYLRGRFR